MGLARWRIVGYGIGLAIRDGADLVPAAALSTVTLASYLNNVTSVTKQYNSVLQRNLESREARRATHWPHVHVLAASAGAWLKAIDARFSPGRSLVDQMARGGLNVT